jgi:3-phenylpropionate/cinnamic acid dioxygenase small subunit
VSELPTSERAVCDFVHHEAMLLDERRYDDWLALFDPDDGCLWVPGRTGESDPSLHVSIIYDLMPRLRMRVARLASGNEAAEAPPSHTLRTITNFRCASPEAGLVTAEAAMVIYQSREVNRMPMAILPSRVRYRLRCVDGPSGEPAFVILQKRLDLLEVHRHLDNMAFLL